jgi:hypothetical protein
MTVFVSYFRPDEYIARQVNQYLRDSGVVTYLDVLDSAIATDGVTPRILSNLRTSTHLVAVISGSTQSSWWVPFEIGVATDRENRIATYAVSSVQLPDYLKIWPILRSNLDLSRFVVRYKEDRRSQTEVRKFSEAAAPIQDAATFHRMLKTDLGQR